MSFLDRRKREYRDVMLGPVDRDERRAREILQRKQVTDRIKMLLLEQNIQQKELADKLGVEKSTLCRYLNLSRTLRIEQIIKIAEILGVSAAELLGETPTDCLERYDTIMRDAEVVKTAAKGSLPYDVDSMARYFDLVNAGALKLPPISRGTGISYSILYDMYARYNEGGKEYIFPPDFRPHETPKKHKEGVDVPE